MDNKQAGKLPVVMSREEVAHFLAAVLCGHRKHTADLNKTGFEPTLRVGASEGNFYECRRCHDVFDLDLRSCECNI
jgi:hypothetical protein